MFIDDVSISQAIYRNSSPTMQEYLDQINRWSGANNMRLNPTRVKIEKINNLLQVDIDSH
jgi:hypothetical protein